MRSSIGTGAVLTFALLVSACSSQAPRPDAPPATPAPQTTPSQPPRTPGPIISPPPVQTTPVPSKPSTQRSHPRYAPPPGVASYWDNNLGVYVVKGRDLYYRQRLFYRFDGDWQCSSRPDGPWESVALPSVPPGLRNR
ncbi:hypothetical protein [Azomonas macrocytogenes]|uniref:Lipoprotein n=1 Tax=Azomonas macrocytogenes TaxID=69962 RepID=A0A839SY08_AZOMA|nr:hypothetical protein [Azomonas macrocytogenes]MBB3101798.1 hypothetical protein [Azomonas macrocytogenes]